MRIGFVGFGEAAYHIAKGLRQPGISSITAFDINVTEQRFGSALAKTEHTPGGIEPGARGIVRHHDVGRDGGPGLECR